jgi:hypothetical protein
MTTIPDILKQRDAAVAVITQQIVAANNFKNAGAAGMDGKINDLEAQKATIEAQAYAAALDDPTMTAALQKLQAGTNDMNTVAGKMTSAASFLANVASFLTTANKLIPVLQGIG